MRRKRSLPRILSVILLTVAAIGFAFPFYFMLVGAFQENPTNSPDELFPTSGWTIDNFLAIDSRIDLVGSLLNSLIFTAGVLLGTVVFGLLAGSIAEFPAETVSEEDILTPVEDELAARRRARASRRTG